MEIKLKERIIGALVLVAIAILVLPWLLDEEKSGSEFVSKIPPPPDAPARTRHPERTRAGSHRAGLSGPRRTVAISLRV